MGLDDALTLAVAIAVDQMAHPARRSCRSGSALCAVVGAAMQQEGTQRRRP
jgi:hypothetical protein